MENTVTISLNEYNKLNEDISKYNRIINSDGYVLTTYYAPTGLYAATIKKEDFNESLFKANKELWEKLFQLKNKNLFQLIKWWFKNKNN